MRGYRSARNHGNLTCAKATYQNLASWHAVLNAENAGDIEMTDAVPETAGDDGNLPASSAVEAAPAEPAPNPEGDKPAANKAETGKSLRKLMTADDNLVCIWGVRDDWHSFILGCAFSKFMTMKGVTIVGLVASSAGRAQACSSCN